MKVAITEETNYPFTVLCEEISNEKLKGYFGSKHYGNDLQELYIRLICVEEKFTDFFKVRRLKYTKEARHYKHKGVQLKTGEGTLKYDSKLDYSKYISLENIRSELANDILNSLPEIKKFKQIKDFDFDGFYNDFKKLFVESEWL